MNNQFFLIGEIKTADKYGFVKVLSHTDDPDRFLRLDYVLIEVFGVTKKFFIEDVEFQKDFVLLKFVNFDDPDKLFFLNGKKMYVEPENAIVLDNDSFFVHDLIGSEVYRNGEIIGKVTDFYSLPANDVYAITNTAGEEYLLPAVKDYILRFDVKDKILVLQPGDDPIYDDED